MECCRHLIVIRIRSLPLETGQAAADDRCDAFLINITVSVPPDQFPAPYERIEPPLRPPARSDLVHQTGIDKCDVPFPHMDLLRLHLTGKRSLNDHCHLYFLVPVPTDISIFKVRKIIQIHTDRKPFRSMRLCLAQVSIHDRLCRPQLLHICTSLPKAPQGQYPDISIQSIPLRL